MDRAVELGAAKVALGVRVARAGLGAAAASETEAVMEAEVVVTASQDSGSSLSACKYNQIIGQSRIQNEKFMHA